jgi:hypothetical protein
LIQRAERVIGEGRLPSFASARYWGGPGSGRVCALCERVIGSHELEIEAELADGSGGPVFHVRCHDAWREACRRCAPLENAGAVGTPEDEHPQD